MLGSYILEYEKGQIHFAFTYSADGLRKIPGETIFMKKLLRTKMET